MKKEKNTEVAQDMQNIVLEELREAEIKAVKARARAVAAESKQRLIELGQSRVSKPKQQKVVFVQPPSARPQIIIEPPPPLMQQVTAPQTPVANLDLREITNLKEEMIDGLRNIQVAQNEKLEELQKRQNERFEQIQKNQDTKMQKFSEKINNILNENMSYPAMQNGVTQEENNMNKTNQEVINEIQVQLSELNTQNRVNQLAPLGEILAYAKMAPINEILATTRAILHMQGNQNLRDTQTQNFPFLPQLFSQIAPQPQQPIIITPADRSGQSMPHYQPPAPQLPVIVMPQHASQAIHPQMPQQSAPPVIINSPPPQQIQPIMHPMMMQPQLPMQPSIIFNSPPQPQPAAQPHVQQLSQQYPPQSITINSSETQRQTPQMQYPYFHPYPVSDIMHQSAPQVAPQAPIVIQSPAVEQPLATQMFQPHVQEKVPQETMPEKTQIIYDEQTKPAPAAVQAVQSVPSAAVETPLISIRPPAPIIIEQPEQSDSALVSIVQPAQKVEESFPIQTVQSTPQIIVQPPPPIVVESPPQQVVQTALPVQNSQTNELDPMEKMFADMANELAALSKKLD
ncbi:MAG: hypothetical protein FWE22_02720 [Firmicutes bacterium]|nr:hypothetical protein [Bacillota bacterium]